MGTRFHLFLASDNTQGDLVWKAGWDAGEASAVRASKRPVCLMQKKWGLGSREGEELCRFGGALCSGSQGSDMRDEGVGWPGPCEKALERASSRLVGVAGGTPLDCLLGPLSAPRDLLSVTLQERLRPSHSQLWVPPHARPC